MKVDLIKARGKEQLVKEVNQRLDDGWSLAGNPFSCVEGFLYWPLANHQIDLGDLSAFNKATEATFNTDYIDIRTLAVCPAIESDIS